MTMLAAQARRERKPLRVGHAIEPGRELDVGRDHVGQPLLEIADAAADLDRDAGPAGRDDAIVEVVVDGAQDRLAIPCAAVVVRADRTLARRLHRLDAQEREQRPCAAA